MVQQVSSFTTLYRAYLEIKAAIEADDATAEVIALDFTSPTIAGRDSRSAGTHTISGRTDDGPTVRGAADINVYVKGTRTPHPREWALLNKHAKPRAKKYGLAYTFPEGPDVWVRSHSGASLHFHMDVSIWGTDRGDCYVARTRAGGPGYYRQPWAGRPTARPAAPAAAKPATPKPATGKGANTGTPFPLPRGVNYAIDDRTRRARSGVNAADRAQIKRIQAAVGATQDGRFGPDTKRAVQRKQHQLGITPDGLVGPTTWARLGL